ncbi:MAG: ferredoxin [Treponema sp.]|nr:MAG: ferredoxin [Treponema sp.]
MTIILLSAGVALVLAFLLGVLLAVFKKLFYVEADKKVVEIREALPGANCGACGFPGCDGFAQAVADGDAPVSGCPVGAGPVAEAIGKIMGVSASSEKKVAMLLCQGTHNVCKNKAGYIGIKTCVAAKLSINGTKNCDWGCIGLGDCEVSCPFDAIKVQDDGLPFIDEEKCTGCGICVEQCPQKILQLMPESLKGAFALCSCHNPKKAVIMKDCKRGCIKCGKCERVCEPGALKLVNGIPQIDPELCTSCGKCVEGCPTKVLILAQDRVKVLPTVEVCAEEQKEKVKQEEPVDA